MMDARQYVDRFENQRVAVLGDAMLDGYLEGWAERVCREAPVPVVRLESERLAPGGAANTASNLAAMGAQVTFVSVVGDDEDGRMLVGLLEERGVSCGLVYTDPERRTIAKRRLVADGQLLVRYDTGTLSPIGSGGARSLLERLRLAVANCDALIISDYRCGLLSDQVISLLPQVREEIDGALIVDSTRLGAYKALSPDVVKPSIAEALAQLAIEPGPASSRSDLAEALGDSLLDLSGASVVTLTVDADGVVAFQRGRHPIHRPAAHHGTAHPAGAGDTFLAAFALASCAGAACEDAVDIAQAAAGIVVREDGTSLCSVDDLLAALSGDEARVCTLDELAKAVAAHRKRGRTIVLTNGCYDILHPGHVALLERAKALGDVLVVGVNSDASVRALKGEGRPVNSLSHRMRVLSALSFVDHLVAFGDSTADRLVELVRPDVYVKGGDYTLDTIPEAPAVERLGGRVEILPHFGNESTSRIIDRIRNSAMEQVS